VPLGLGFVQMLAWFFPQFFANGVVISWGGVLFAGGVSLLAALAASVLPAINAMRVDPLEAMSAVAKVRCGQAPWGWALVGVGLMSIDPLVTFVPWDRIAASAGLEALAIYHRDIRFYLHFVLGIPGVLIGAFLIAPLAVWSIDRWIAPLVARLIGLKPQLLQQQLGGAMWRAAGTGAALMVGLGVLIVMQTQGRSGMGAWQLPTKFPDAFVWSATGGIDDRALDKLGALPGVIGGREAIMPIGVFSPEYADSMFGLAGLAFMPNATTFIAVDPDRVFDLMGLEFRQGDPASAQVMLKKGRHLLVTEELSRVRNLGIGDSLGLKRSDGSVIEYTIAGVVWSPGIDVMVAAFDMRRQFDQRTAASVFGTIDDARRDFNKTSFELAAVNIEDGVSKQELLSNLQAEMSRVGLAVADVRRLKGDILTRVDQLLMLGSTVAWCAMLVATLGVTNTVMAGIRVRQWQFGVLRSIGATRGTLLRLVLAESVLLGAIGVVMGLTTGLVMSLDAWKFYDIIIGFRPPLIIPWDAIAAGIVVVLAGSVVATIIPAVRAARADVLSMLQAGRASS
jgi:putative ABC transport system permease protein